MQTITMYYAEGEAAHSGNVEAHEAESHIQAGGRFADEAKALVEFRNSDRIPGSLLHGEYVLQAEGTSESGASYARYVRVAS